MKNIALVLSVFLLGCSHSMTTMTNTVQAQAGFTNGDITGNYAWDFGGRVGSSGTLTTTIVGTGRVFANGAFNGSFSETMADITSNKITVCSGTISGGYSVNGDGTGTATINTIGSVNQTGPGPCGFMSPIGFNFVMLNQGHVIGFSSNDGNNSVSMTMQSQ